VYQIDPSGATVGSCGYAGLLGVIHCSIVTSTLSVMAGAACTSAAAATPRAASERNRRMAILPSMEPGFGIRDSGFADHAVAVPLTTDTLPESESLQPERLSANPEARSP